MKKLIAEKNVEGKCFHYKGADHFAQDYKVKKNNTEKESYEIN